MIFETGAWPFILFFVFVVIFALIVNIYQIKDQKKLELGRAVSHQLFQQQVLEYSQYLVAYGVFLSEFMGPHPRGYVPNPLPPKSPAEFGLRFVSTYIEKEYVFVQPRSSFSASTSTSDRRTNPATGFPMAGGVDVMGNAYGMNRHQSIHC